MQHKILVSYSTRILAGVEFDPTDLVPPANYKTPETIAKWTAAKKEDFLISAANQPYTGTFTEIQLAVAGAGKVLLFKEDPDPTKDTPAEKAAAAIIQNSGDAFTAPFGQAKDECFLYGFNIRDFLKILGTECSLPRRKTAMPGLWINNSDHRDIAELVKPKEYALSWPMVLKARNLQESFGTWLRPHVSAEQDLMLIAELATQLGLIGKIPNNAAA